MIDIYLNFREWDVCLTIVEYEFEKGYPSSWDEPGMEDSAWPTKYFLSLDQEVPDGPHDGLSDADILFLDRVEKDNENLCDELIEERFDIVESSILNHIIALSEKDYSSMSFDEEY